MEEENTLIDLEDISNNEGNKKNSLFDTQKSLKTGYQNNENEEIEDDNTLNFNSSYNLDRRLTVILEKDDENIRKFKKDFKMKETLNENIKIHQNNEENKIINKTRKYIEEGNI